MVVPGMVVLRDLQIDLAGVVLRFDRLQWQCNGDIAVLLTVPGRHCGGASAEVGEEVASW